MSHLTSLVTLITLTVLLLRDILVIHLLLLLDSGVRNVALLGLHLPALGGAGVPGVPVLGQVELDRQELPDRDVIKLACDWSVCIILDCDWSVILAVQLVLVQPALAGVLPPPHQDVLPLNVRLPALLTRRFIKEIAKSNQLTNV